MSTNPGVPLMPTSAYEVWQAIFTLQHKLGRDTRSTRFHFHAHGRTPLMVACMCSQHEAAAALIAAGAQLDMVNSRRQRGNGECRGAEEWRSERNVKEWSGGREGRGEERKREERRGEERRGEERRGEEGEQRSGEERRGMERSGEVEKRRMEEWRGVEDWGGVEAWRGVEWRMAREERQERRGGEKEREESAR